ncbi:flagellar biosynthesis anti-sigma factor FlgM [Dechloromonas sp. XY25]|uniref:Negative regulator of flagellin synthesis n=1 Tax=Dechloromonas hankyongensis TaxID=2908002 RepID=A0ABS9K6N1_9RHOO|nr:flagellar biosynthesis anti-sigma factor FlgM [Dechloromonas hankyongensis]MCG2578834.1 flagellar biosynthesis anti-sigma factor FlgM [Dechloromonas hankyongensis]
MKIDNSYKPASPLPSSRQQTAPPAANAAQDAVSLSSLAGSLQSNDQPPVNSAKIQEIKQAIAEGRFKINPEAIADGLIESARELIGRRQA